MEKPNQMVQMDILGPFYLENSDKKNYFISCEDDCSRKVTNEIEQEILDLRTTRRFGCNHIRFRLKRLKEISLSTRTIYRILKRHGLNILECKIKNRKWKRFAMEKPNQMVQMDILGPFYLENSDKKNYILSVVKMTVQEKHQVTGLKENEV